MLYVNNINERFGYLNRINAVFDWRSQQLLHNEKGYTDRRERRPTDNFFIFSISIAIWDQMLYNIYA